MIWNTACLTALLLGTAVTTRSTIQAFAPPQAMSSRSSTTSTSSSTQLYSSSTTQQQKGFEDLAKEWAARNSENWTGGVSPQVAEFLAPTTAKTTAAAATTTLEKPTAKTTSSTSTAVADDASPGGVTPEVADFLAPVETKKPKPVKETAPPKASATTETTKDDETTTTESSSKAKTSAKKTPTAKSTAASKKKAAKKAAPAAVVQGKAPPKAEKTTVTTAPRGSSVDQLEKGNRIWGVAASFVMSVALLATSPLWGAKLEQGSTAVSNRVINSGGRVVDVASLSQYPKTIMQQGTIASPVSAFKKLEPKYAATTTKTFPSVPPEQPQIVRRNQQQQQSSTAPPQSAGGATNAPSLSVEKTQENLSPITPPPTSSSN
eukprot:scaffold4042_cov165-Amphora_coffeaeformis.AAC.4